MGIPPSETPSGEIVIRTTAMPSDTNANGDIFGGWLMSQMDLGGATLARKLARGRVVTVAVEAMTFRSPVKVGDIITCYAEKSSVGRTSMKIRLTVWKEAFLDTPATCVTEGVFTFVAVDESGRPQPVERP